MIGGIKCQEEMELVRLEEVRELEEDWEGVPDKDAVVAKVSVSVVIVFVHLVEQSLHIRWGYHVQALSAPNAIR